jgi:hypothetical protein
MAMAGSGHGREEQAMQARLQEGPPTNQWPTPTTSDGRPMENLVFSTKSWSTTMAANASPSGFESRLILVHHDQEGHMQHEVWAYFRPQNEVSMAQLVQEAVDDAAQAADVLAAKATTPAGDTQQNSQDDDAEAAVAESQVVGADATGAEAAGAAGADAAGAEAAATGGVCLDCRAGRPPRIMSNNITDHHVMDLHQTQCLPLLASQAGAAGADSVEVRMSMVPALVETTQMERPTKRPRGEGSHKDAYWHKAPGFLEPLPGFVEAYWHKAHATLQSRKNGDVWRLVTVHHDKQGGVVHEVWECRRARQARVPGQLLCTICCRHPCISDCHALS